MPITAKLSRKFYDKLGEEVANELVEWLNAVDATYRADLGDLNERNFGRFDAKLEQRLVELDAKWGSRWTALDVKFEQRLLELDGKIERRLAESDTRWEGRLADLRVEIHRTRADLVKWMFLFWAPTALGVVSLLLRH